MISQIKRFFIHLFSGPWLVHRYFSNEAMRHIESAIESSERLHSGQVRFAVEAGLHPYSLLKGVSPKSRALEIFSALGIWDTAQNNGVLIYLLLADHDVEIIADRGINQRVADSEWASICYEMEQFFAQGKFEDGVLHGIERITLLLTHCFPAPAESENELPNKPLVF